MISLTLQSSKSCVSVALYRKAKMLSFIKLKKKEIKRTENLMQLLEKLLKDFPGKQISQIIFTRGPGSFTAIRSVTAIAQGLALGFGAKLKTLSTFEAILGSFDFPMPKCVVIFRDSREEFLFQFFQQTSSGSLVSNKINSGDLKKIKIAINRSSSKGKLIILSDQRYKIFSDPFFEKHLLKIIEYDAKSLFEAHSKGYSSESIKPIYFFKHYAN